MNKRSIGCAKTKLVGEYNDPDLKKGSSTDLIYKNEIIGKVLRSRDSVKPIFVSIGYKMDLENAKEIILHCCEKYRIPKPIRQSHILANQLRKNKL